MIDGIFRLMFPLSYPLLIFSLHIAFVLSGLCIGITSALFLLFLLHYPIKTYHRRLTFNMYSIVPYLA